MKIQLFDKNDSLFKTVKRIRRAVFTEEQGIPVQVDLDDYDRKESTLYCLASDGEPCATGRLIAYQGGCKIGRIATLQAYRGRGCGAAVVNALCDAAFAQGAESVYLEAQLPAVAFYEKLGFNVISDDIIVDSGIRHLAMRRVH